MFQTLPKRGISIVKGLFIMELHLAYPASSQANDQKHII